MTAKPGSPKKRTRPQSENGWSSAKSIFLKAIGAGPAATATVSVTFILALAIFTLGSANLTTVLLKILDNNLLGAVGWVLFGGTTLMLNLNRRRHSIELERITEERNIAQSRQIPVASSTEKSTLQIKE